MGTQRSAKGFRGALHALVAGAALLCGGSGESSATTQGIGIELNRLQQVDGACRLSFVYRNGLDAAIDALVIETVLFDRQGSVERIMVLKSRPLSPLKVRVQQFDLRDSDCGSIGKVLLNDVKECRTGTEPAATCAGLVKPSSRADVAFFSTLAEQEHSDAGRRQ